jgi:hypothetical protein
VCGNPNFFSAAVFFSALNQTLHLNRLLAVASLRLLGMITEFVIDVDWKTFEHCYLNVEIHWQE